MDPLAIAIWKKFALNKCKLFLWLAHKNRLYTNDRRFWRGIVESDSCPFCAGTEITDHLLFHCNNIKHLWDELNSFSGEHPINLQHLWGHELSNKSRSSVIIALLWNIWKRRNTKLASNDSQPIHTITRACADDLILWSNRCQNEERKELLQDWRSMLYHLSLRL